MAQNAIDLLEQEHREAEQLLAQMKGTQGADTTLLNTTAEELQIHMKIEEEVLYPFIRREVPEGKDLMNEAEEEHQEARQALQKVQQTAGTPDFEAALAKLTKGIQHHVKEEENEVFPKLRKTVDEAKLVEFGKELDQAKQELKSSGRFADGAGSSEGKTRDELYAEAKEIGIEGRSKMNKSQLIKALRNH